ncbi:MAG: DNA methylase, partial [Actinomycetota bacterium]|nr:DNA methylase [Actinomycetota bacterium]
TKLELLLLGLISSEEELRALRARAITAGINNVSRRIPEPVVLDEVEPIATRLDQVAYDPRIPQLVRAYFSDMKRVLERARNAMKPGGRLVLDIGDSCFAGVHVDTPSVLCQLAEGVGWEFKESVVLRSRSSKDGTPLCQKLLYLSSQ